MMVPPAHSCSVNHHPRKMRALHFDSMRSQPEPLTLACFFRLHGHSPSILSCSISSFLVFSSPSILSVPLHVAFAIVSITTTPIHSLLSGACHLSFLHTTYYFLRRGSLPPHGTTLHRRHRRSRSFSRPFRTFSLWHVASFSPTSVRLRK